MNSKLTNTGFTLIEIVIVILIIGIIATVAMRKMNQSIESAQYEQTKKELDNLAWAISGNPDVYAAGARTDFGYVGDIGALPTSLDDLVQNPGGYATWDGPYMNRGFNNNDFKTDAWGSNYTLSDTLIRSTGSGSNIDKLFAGSSAALLSNSVNGWVADADRQVPGSSEADSVTIILGYPDGSGGTTYASTSPSRKGAFGFTGVPIGNHTLRVIYIPDSDTVSYPVTVCPNRDVKLDIIFPSDLW